MNPMPHIKNIVVNEDGSLSLEFDIEEEIIIENYCSLCKSHIGSHVFQKELFVSNLAGKSGYTLGKRSNIFYSSDNNDHYSICFGDHSIQEVEIKLCTSCIEVISNNEVNSKLSKLVKILR